MDEETKKRLERLQEIVTVHGKGPERIVFVGDYTQLELYAIGALLHETSSDDEFRDMLTKLTRVDTMPYPEQVIRDKPAMKQNGRSAAYLKHDRTKRHR